MKQKSVQKNEKNPGEELKHTQRLQIKQIKGGNI